VATIRSCETNITQSRCIRIGEAELAPGLEEEGPWEGLLVSAAAALAEDYSPEVVVLDNQLDRVLQGPAEEGSPAEETHLEADEVHRWVVAVVAAGHVAVGVDHGVVPCCSEIEQGMQGHHHVKTREHVERGEQQLEGSFPLL